MILPRVIAWWEALTGVFKAGLVATPGPTLLTARDLAYRIEACEAAGVIVDAALADRVDEALAGSGQAVRARIVVGDKSERPGWLDYDTVLASATS